MCEIHYSKCNWLCKSHGIISLATECPITYQHYCAHEQRAVRWVAAVVTRAQLAAATAGLALTVAAIHASLLSGSLELVPHSPTPLYITACAFHVLLLETSNHSNPRRE